MTKMSKKKVNKIFFLQNRSSNTCPKNFCCQFRTHDQFTTTITFHRNLLLLWNWNSTHHSLLVRLCFGLILKKVSFLTHWNRNCFCSRLLSESDNEWYHVQNNFKQVCVRTLFFKTSARHVRNAYLWSWKSIT